jgi:hypothetical protein
VAAVVKLIRHAPRASLEEFFTAQSCPLSERLRDIAPEAEYAGLLIKAVDELSDEAHAQLTVNAERVTEMADEVGQTALLAVVQAREIVEGLENPCARSLWAFLNEPVSFRRAEEIRYTDQHREGRSWSGYAAPKRLMPATGETALDTFKAKALGLFGSTEGHCEIYRRTRPSLDTGDSELFQLTLYRDDLPDTYFAFEGGHLVRRHRRPVVEVLVTYEPAARLIAVADPVRRRHPKRSRRCGRRACVLSCSPATIAPRPRRWRANRRPAVSDGWCRMDIGGSSKDANWNGRGETRPSS